MIYFDHNSTTLIRPAVAAAIHAAYLQGFVNPASQHRLGQAARHRLESARRRVAELLGAETAGMAPDRLIFTSGGTEANNLALRGLAGADRNRQILVTSIEHPSVLGPAEFLATQGFPLREIPVDRQGICDLEALRDLLARPTALVSVMWANHETGALQPIADIVSLAHAQGARVHTDAVQAVGKVPVNFRTVGVDALTFTSHKFYGPRGIGGVLLRSGLQLVPLLFGGFQQQGSRPGTEDVALAVGCQVALESCLNDLSGDAHRIAVLRDGLFSRLQSAELGELHWNAASAPRLPNTLNLSFPGIDRQALMLAADLAGLAISTGSACASGSSEPSGVLKAMGLSPARVESAVRISLGIETTPEEIESAAAILTGIVRQMRAKKSGLSRME